MRKELWGCAAAALAAAGVSGLVAFYAWEHPDSWLGRCAAAAHRVVRVEAAVVGSAGNPAGLAVRGMQGLVGTVAAPQAVREEAAPCPGHVAPPDEELDVMPPAVLPGVVAIPADDVLPARPMPAVHDFVGGLPVMCEPEECDEFPMPRAEDDAARMPPVPDGAAKCDTPPEQPACPHLSGRICVPRTIKGREGHSGNEECEPIFPQLQRDDGEHPKHPEVDTMEVRPSDLWFFDFMGPF
jgi:hypothetical protein